MSKRRASQSRSGRHGSAVAFSRYASSVRCDVPPTVEVLTHPCNEGATHLRAPIATYRVQLSQAFTFRDLEQLTSYLRDLGVSDCYCSPILSARPGSTHGYDICDHSSINSEIGTRADLDALSSSLKTNGLGLIVDFVPNHMGIDPQTNVWWRDVLEQGPGSPYARFFDIDWHPIKEELRNKVLLAILGDQYGEVLERGELQVSLVDGLLMLQYFDRTLPLNPVSAAHALGQGSDDVQERLGEKHPDVVELRDILQTLANLPSSRGANGAVHSERERIKQSACERLDALVRRSCAIREHINGVVAALNGRKGISESFDALHSLLETQAYRLASWRTAFDEINYRRFFDINDLGGLRMEDPRVFAATHGLLLDLVAQGVVSGIRLDHPDGLFDPAAYFQSLRAALAERRGADDELYILIEKILGRGERLRESWPVHGTTGYGFLNIINGVFVHPERLTSLRRMYREFTNQRLSPSDTEYASKRTMMRTAMASELNVLARALNRISETDRQFRDFTLNSLRRALVEVIACFPVYRTYVSAHGASEEDVTVVDAAIHEARRRNPVQEPSIFAFIREVLLPPPPEAGAAIDRWRDRSVAFAHRFQQYTAPVVAKGIEDTAFYNDVLLLSANEVGGDLRHRTRSVSELHRENLHRLTRWPLEMTAGSTHDTKRGEDARARINVIAELSDEWRAQLSRWTAINDGARSRLNATVAPDRTDEWMYYQALVGAWPAEAVDAPLPATAPPDLVDRMRLYMRKAMKEAKRHTSWAFENQPYEEAVLTFVEATLSGATAPRFLASFLPFQRRVAWFGMINSLAQLVVRIGSPGVPDFYQGSELWNLSLVDPDNRRAVDFARRQTMLAELGAAPDLRDVFERWPDGRVKLLTLMRALRFRRDHPDLFIRGDYEPLSTDDDQHLIAFGRRWEGEELILVVPRFLATLMRGTPQNPLGMDRWRTTSIRLPRRLARTPLMNVFTQEIADPLVHRDVPWLLAGAAFQSWPVALLYATIGQ
jgi:(1->4)-alpha-D-glucan 1-alpha-D-glucosylmutase